MSEVLHAPGEVVPAGGRIQEAGMGHHRARERATAGAQASSKLRGSRGAGEGVPGGAPGPEHAGGEGPSPAWRRSLANTAVLIVGHDRSDYLDRCLSALVKYHPGGGVAPVVVSEDGRHGPMADVVRKHRAELSARHPDVPLLHLNHQQRAGAENGYFLLAEHYKWALNQVRGATQPNSCTEPMRCGLAGVLDMTIGLGLLCIHRRSTTCRSWTGACSVWTR
jgi:hypothetical protein